MLTVRQNHPLDALVCRVIDRLLDVIITKGDADGLHLDQRLQLTFDLRRKVAIRSANRILPRNLSVLVEPEDLREHIGHDQRRIALVHVAVLRRLQNGLESLQAGRQAICDFFRDRPE